MLCRAWRRPIVLDRMLFVPTGGALQDGAHLSHVSGAPRARRKVVRPRQRLMPTGLRHRDDEHAIVPASQNIADVKAPGRQLPSPVVRLVTLVPRRYACCAAAQACADGGRGAELHARASPRRLSGVGGRGCHSAARCLDVQHAAAAGKALYRRWSVREEKKRKSAFVSRIQAVNSSEPFCPPSPSSSRARRSMFSSSV